MSYGIRSEVEACPPVPVGPNAVRWAFSKVPGRPWGAASQSAPSTRNSGKWTMVTVVGRAAGSSVPEQKQTLDEAGEPETRAGAGVIAAKQLEGARAEHRARRDQARQDHPEQSTSLHRWVFYPIGPGPARQSCFRGVGGRNAAGLSAGALKRRGHTGIIRVLPAWPGGARGQGAAGAWWAMTRRFSVTGGLRARLIDPRIWP